MNLLKEIIKIKNEKNLIEISDKDVALSKEEKEVIRYVARYVIFSLGKKYNRLSKSKVTSTKNDAIHILELLKITHEKYD